MTKISLWTSIKKFLQEIAQNIKEWWIKEVSLADRLYVLGFLTLLFPIVYLLLFKSFLLRLKTQEENSILQISLIVSWLFFATGFLQDLLEGLRKIQKNFQELSFFGPVIASISWWSAKIITYHYLNWLTKVDPHLLSNSSTIVSLYFVVWIGALVVLNFKLLKPLLRPVFVFLILVYCFFKKILGLSSLIDTKKYLTKKQPKKVNYFLVAFRTMGNIMALILLIHLVSMPIKRLSTKEEFAFFRRIISTIIVVCDYYQYSYCDNFCPAKGEKILQINDAYISVARYEQDIGYTFEIRLCKKVTSKLNNLKLSDH